MTGRRNQAEGNNTDREKLLLEQYERFLCGFCKECAYMEDLKIKVEKGLTVTKAELVTHFMNLRNCREALLETKKELGMSGGISFTENTNFQGFSYRNGQLVGDCTHLYRIIKPWLAHFNPKDPAKYEVGMLLLFHYGFREERMQKELKAEKRKLFKEKVFHFIIFHKWIKRRKQK